MSGSWIDAVVRTAAVARVVRAVVIETKGSTPREVGAWMLIADDFIDGTIGGGALEHACIARARGMLGDGQASPWQRAVESFHLGPELNQCCGGVVTILLESYGPVEVVALRAGAQPGGNVSAVHPLEAGRPIEFGLAAAAGAEGFVEALVPVETPVMLYGAGHVGRALVRALEGLPFAVTWCDAEREGGPAAADVVGGDLPVIAAAAPRGAFHLVMTHSHSLDEAIVAAVLQAGTFGYLGLIGSATKAARFRQRLLRAGIDPAVVAEMHCPIGLPGLAGKAPAVIAVSAVADLLLRRQKQIDRVGAVQ
jgi:xanthine dehydrogenase accessory factor